MRASSRNPRRAGFTVVELLVSVTLTALLLAALATYQVSAARAASETSLRSQLTSEASTTLHRLAEDLRWADPGSLIVAEALGVTALEFSTVVGENVGVPLWSSPIAVQAELGNVDSDGDGVRDDLRLVRVQDGRRRVLTSHLAPNGFTASLDDDRLELTLKLWVASPATGRLLNHEASTTIGLRN